MKFRITEEHRFWHDVKVRMPVPGASHAGEVEEFEFTAQFLSPTRARLREIISARLDPDGDQIGDIVRETLVGWDGPVDEDDNPVAFGPLALDAAVQSPWFVPAVYRALIEALNTDTKAGN